MYVFVFADQSHLLTVHLEVLSINLNAYNYHLIVPFSTDGGVPNLSNIKRRIHTSNDLRVYGPSVSNTA